MNKQGRVTLAVFLMAVLASVLVLNFVFAAPRGLAQCKDGIDNDGDGYTDWPNDPGCINKNDQSELGTNECDDGIDNDGDGNSDMNDAGCSSPSDLDESNCGDSVCEGGETSATCPADCGYQDSCSDSDGGNLPFTFGATSGYYNNNPFSHDDYCVDSSNIMEYFCSGNYEQSQQQNCGTDGYTGGSYCVSDSVYRDYRDFLCSSGECSYTDTPTLQKDCDSYDNYGSNYCLSGSVYRDYNDYFCSFGECNFTVTPELVELCYYGCTNGACDQYNNTCFETDGGFNPDLQGITSGSHFGEDYFYEDYCFNSTMLMEYYCIGDNPTEAGFACSGNYSACIDGICI